MSHNSLVGSFPSREQLLSGFREILHVLALLACGSLFLSM